MTTAILKALFLYHLMEYQTGHADTIKVSNDGTHFQISDNGRGHAIEKKINNLSYMDLVYTQLDYPYGQDIDTPIQLHTIGISLVNVLCSELTVTIFKPDQTCQRMYQNGKLVRDETRAEQNPDTGNRIAGVINADLITGELDGGTFGKWLEQVKMINPSLNIFFNDRQL